MAADLSQTFVGKHFEKIVLAAAAVILFGAFGWFVAMRRGQEGMRTDVARLVDELKKKTAEPSLDQALTKEERVALGIDETPTTTADFEKHLNGPASAWQPLSKMVPDKIVAKGPVEADVVIKPPAAILAVEDLDVAVGRGVTAEAVPNFLAKLDAKATSYDVAWVGCVGKFDLTAQLDEYVKGNAKRQPILITRVELRRREMKTDGSWTDWKGVAPAVPSAIAAKLPKAPLSNQDMATVRTWFLGVTSLQAEIRRMPFYALITTDQEGQTVESLTGVIAGVEQPDLRSPEETAPKPPEGAPAGPAAPAAEPPKKTEIASPFDLLGQPAERPATGTGPTVAGPAAVKHVYATVWANDATVETGKTYQYQMRVWVFNPVWSTPGVAEDKRWVVEFAGDDWSKPSREVTVPGTVEFFFVGTFRDKANLELHRWIHGQWVIVPSAQFSIGGPVVFTKRSHEIVVPGTNDKVRKDIDLMPSVLLVDAMRNYPYQPEGNNRPISTNVLVFADPQGRLSHRIEWDDRKRAMLLRIERQSVVPGGPAKVGTPPPPPPPPKPEPPKPKPRPTRP